MKYYHNNPRRISAKRFQQLETELGKLGDLGGIVHNLPTDEVIGGNQRVRVFGLVQSGAATLEIVHEYAELTAAGTRALGFITHGGERFSYRAVEWDADTCAEANVVANALGGDWDWDNLAAWDVEKLQEWGLDADALAGWNDDAANLALMLDAEKVGSAVGFEGDSDVFKDNFIILISCANEEQQVALLDQFIAEGLECRALI